MRWLYTSTDTEYRKQFLSEESLRHERLFNQSMLLSEIELTPPTEPLPKMTMARLRQQKLEEETEKVRDIWEQDTSDIPGL